MKRFSMAMTWLALAGLMTTVSCRKPVVGFTNGESRTVTISAVTESGGGSKTTIDGLNVKWSKDDQIRMNAESVLTLEDECVGSTMGRFTGEVKGDGPYRIGYPAGKTTYDGETLKLNIPASWTYDADMKEIVPMVAYAASVDDDVYFRNAVNMLKLQLKGDGTPASKLKSIVLTSTTSNLSGDIEVTFSNGIPTFDAIAGDGASKTMTVSFSNGGLQLGETVQCVYIPLARISGGEVLTVRFVCAGGEMEKKVTAIEAFNAVNNMLNGGVVEVKAVPKFSVSATTKVEFAPGNLYWDGTDSKWKFEENQWDYPVGDFYYTEWGTLVYNWDPNHVGHFYWSNTTDWQASGMEPYAEDYLYSTRETNDVFFTNDPEDETKPNENFQVSGEAAGTWRALSRAEWDYLLGYDPEIWEQTETCGRPGAKAKSAWKDLGGGVSGFVILPDDADASVMGSINSTSDLATHGAVFLPAAGCRFGTDVVEVGSDGYYWSSAPYEGSEGRAYIMGFYSGFVYMNYDPRGSGYAVRLVR